LRLAAPPLFLLLCLCQAAQAQEPTPELDTTTRNILCFGMHERMDDRAFRNIVRVFTAPEPDPANPKAMRLYVGFVESEHEAGKRQILYRGPLALDWERPHTPKAFVDVDPDKRPLRYHLDRVYLGPGGTLEGETAEIDLDAKPPVVRYLLREPGKPPREIVERFVPQPLTPSAKLLLRSDTKCYGKDALALCSLNVMAEGDYYKGAGRRHAQPLIPHYYLVSDQVSKRCVLHALPARRSWWQERLLHAVKPQSEDGSFVVEILEGYSPQDDKDLKKLRDRRLRVTVSLKELRWEVVDEGLLYDGEQSVFYIP
jgi:hypothetical protein